MLNSLYIRLHFQCFDPHIWGPRRDRKGNVTVDDQFIRRKFLQTLPPTSRIALSAHHNLPLEDFAKLADTIFKDSTIDCQVAAVRNDNKRDKDRAKFSKYPFTAKNAIVSFSDGQKQKICRFYVVYAQYAKRCKPWCKWPDQKPQIIDASSRPSTPTHQASN